MADVRLQRIPLSILTSRELTGLEKMTLIAICASIKKQKGGWKDWTPVSMADMQIFTGHAHQSLVKGCSNLIYKGFLERQTYWRTAQAHKRNEYRLTNKALGLKNAQ